MSDELYIGTVKKRMVGNTCPKCGKSAEGGTAFDVDQPPKGTPKEGDYSVCLYCGTLSAFDSNLKLVPLDRKARRALMRDPRLKKVLEIAADAAASVRRKWQ